MPEHINIGNRVARPLSSRARARRGTWRPQSLQFLTLVRPRRRLTPVPTAEQSSHRAQRQCKDGAQRHPKGLSLTGASTMAASGGSGPDGATHTHLPHGPSNRDRVAGSTSGECGLRGTRQKSVADEGSQLGGGGGAHSSRKTSLIFSS